MVFIIMAVNIKIRARRLLNPINCYSSWEDIELPKEISRYLSLAKGEIALGIYNCHPPNLKDAIVVTSQGLWIFYDKPFEARFIKYTNIASSNAPNKTKKGTTLDIKLTDETLLTLQVTGWNEDEYLTDAALFLQFLIYIDMDIEKETGKSGAKWYTLSDLV
jgi:hypothetical protein